MLLPDEWPDRASSMMLCLSRAIECPYCGLMHRPFSLVVGTITVIEQVMAGDFASAAKNQAWIDIHPDT